ncbi:hypothetical protein Cob_v002469 [Colletotrichum orbiculare MAFF 240422]|uniref:Uncharacterized protein n=1 Tax=Colletotrichum orbiculare (strain 104-T / ATCC 96160 / CBS 514.97 / LARS 414 / MAFF 240422) TaxID=1213857 RepID=A0A484G3Y6_COLOR|nr:hypothetical protein Cob_v002469 [Colletotrichum orbiculare MAFF 240422]
MKQRATFADTGLTRYCQQLLFMPGAPPSVFVFALPRCLAVAAVTMRCVAFALRCAETRTRSQQLDVWPKEQRTGYPTGVRNSTKNLPLVSFLSRCWSGWLTG